ncbi:MULTISPECIES: N-acetylmuramoyl-L-alanine amidase [unclassified Paenibacillus]|uniref:peptidoglycan recognition protein family protein n=1 Tax=unclassified Paenibacillus TaxID=185978 RepID=UPI0009544385|nr:MULTISPECIES: N-acetylmuramoyl-L-alanine amidase [unclassified Paenibacillus]ASS66469.1 N-acetylmuramoyl-L-alanine amidase [Paenibacillus sp. RUD330]SIQ03454.1 N-acetylmuramoyl-L-alanine amidase [Paenibacillus sp. RU4X]SIQ23225.1 N-acetylmuramoyl-L-alanine amidase [Paenibacillus sp. RU4T]
MDDTSYPIERRYIAVRSNTRPGARLITGCPAFLVAHDTGNPGAGADAHFRYFDTLRDRTASAHVFIDDRRILEIIPAGTGEQAAEKAWHVIRNVTTDNERFGYDANDAALGVELCYGGGIGFEAAYGRYVWYLAFCCRKWGLNPSSHIVTHRQLDPMRKQDCEQSLAWGGKSFAELIADVRKVLAASSPSLPEQPASMHPSKPQPLPQPQPQPKLPQEMCSFLIVSYIQPARHSMLVAGDEAAASHYERLAANVRGAAAGQSLPKSNCQEIVYNWLSPAWHRAKAEGRDPAKYHVMAEALRACAGIPSL